MVTRDILHEARYFTRIVGKSFSLILNRATAKGRRQLVLETGGS